MNTRGESPSASYGSDWLGEYGFGNGDEDELPEPTSDGANYAPADSGVSATQDGGGGNALDIIQDAAEPSAEKEPITMQDAGTKLATFVDEFGDVQVDLQQYAKQVIQSHTNAIQRLIDTGTWTEEMANKEGWYRQPDGNWAAVKPPGVSGEYGFGGRALSRVQMMRGISPRRLPFRPHAPQRPKPQKPRTVRGMANAVIVAANRAMRSGMPRKVAVQKMRAAMTKTFKKIAARKTR
jgi:hypothetical protein